MSSIAPGLLTYCPRCIDVFGVLDGRAKRCRCRRSDHLPVWRDGDFPTPLEICWYCQARIIGSGSRWSVFFCDGCRRKVVPLNDELDRMGLISLPIGRHSLMHVRWKHARPFTAAPLAYRWRCWRLAAASRELGGGLRDWPELEAHLQVRPPELGYVVRRVQRAPVDELALVLAQANTEAGRGRLLREG